jgi:hypothetical protein
VKVYHRSSSISGFQGVVKTLASELIDAPAVDTGHWQAIKDVPQTKTRELRGTVFEMPIPESQQWLADEVQPNLPFAEAQFQDRVSGQPLNPPPSHKLWPWARHNATHQNRLEPEVDERDWAYLAALIDGEGSFSAHKHPDGRGDRIRVSIGQKDGEFLRAIAARFPELGSVKTRGTPSKCGNYMSYWSISRKGDLKWFLPHVIPYLVLKREQAEATLQWVNSLGEHGHDKPFGEEGEPRFSHSYPERLWPPRGYGIRFPHGNLQDAVELLDQHPTTRQCVVPIWHAEDLAAANRFSERVPCTLLYHFMCREGKMHMTYPIRSCDFLRHFRDDVYMGARLCQWMCEQVSFDVVPGTLTFHAMSLHVFEGDLPMLRRMAGA